MENESNHIRMDLMILAIFPKCNDSVHNIFQVPANLMSFE